jgi:hypothetical protein
MFFNDFKNKPLLYQIWGISVLISAFYGLFRVITLDSLTKNDHLIMAYTHFSILVSYFLSRVSNK